MGVPGNKNWESSLKKEKNNDNIKLLAILLQNKM